jgi:hypothetical protein
MGRVCRRIYWVGLLYLPSQILECTTFRNFSLSSVVGLLSFSYFCIILYPGFPFCQRSDWIDVSIIAQLLWLKFRLAFLDLVMIFLSIKIGSTIKVVLI